MEDFVPFEIAKKLKEKGFTCKYPFAMYNELGSYCPLTTSSDYVTCESGYKYRCYYDYNDFDENDFIAPTISQVLKWLFNKKQLFVNIDCNICDKFGLFFTIYKKGEETWEACGFDDNYYNKPEEATLAGIEYVLDNLI